MTNRLFNEGLITTILGMVIILIAVIAWVLKTEIVASEAAIIAGIGTGLLFVKDKHVGIKRNNDMH